jgi:hypothetical protein
VTISLIPPVPPPSPRLDLLEVCWRMRGPSGKVLACGIYQTDGVFEVRVSYPNDDLLRSVYATDIDTARELAKAWKQLVLAKGNFTELPLSEGT